MTNNYTQVVVGIIFNKSNKQFLLAKRPINKPYSGYWEFAGGKVECNETHTQALHRELKEEININVEEKNMQFTFSHSYSYENFKVELHFYLITQWQGNILALENQQLLWFNLQEFPQPLLPSLEEIIPQIFQLTI